MVPEPGAVLAAAEPAQAEPPASLGGEGSRKPRGRGIVGAARGVCVT